MSELPFKGTLQDVSFPSLLVYLNTWGRTGTLTVSFGVVCKKVFLKEGEAVFASSNSNDDWLGVSLVKAGKISLQQFEFSTEVMKKSGKRHGAVLVELGYITPKELFWAVKYQVREIIYSLFEYDRAEYEFVEGRIPEEVITLKMSMGSLIYEGVSRIDNLIRIKEEIPPVWTVLQLNDDPMRLFQSVQFSPKDKKILSLVDGQRTIKQVIEDSWFNSFEAMKIIYVFWTIGILTEKKMETENISLDVLFVDSPAADVRDAFAAKAAALHEKLSGINPYELLELQADATLPEIKKNYYRLAREFHPERIFDSDEQHLRDKLVEIFDSIKKAYASLIREREEGPDAGARAAAIETNENEITPADDDVRSENILEIADDAQDVEKTPSGKIESLREAVKRDPSTPENWRGLAMALCGADGDFSPEEAERAMFEAIGITPFDGDCYAELGYVYLRAGRGEEAKRQFEKSLVLDPENRKAIEGLKQF